MALDPGLGSPLGKRKRIRIPGIGGTMPDVGGGIGAPPLAGPINVTTPGTPGQSWADLIRSDALYQQGLADLGGEEVQAAAGRRSAIQRALIQMGLLTPGMLDSLRNSLGQNAPMLAEDIDPNTVSLAAANQNSVAAQMKRQHESNVLALQDVLAAKGMLRTGQTGYELGEEQRRMDQGSYDAINQLMDALGGVYSGYAQGVSERNRRKSDLGASTVDRLMAAGISPAPGTPATTRQVAGPPAPNLAGAFARARARSVRRPQRRPGLREQ